MSGSLGNLWSFVPGFIYISTHIHDLWLFRDLHFSIIYDPMDKFWYLAWWTLFCIQQPSGARRPWAWKGSLNWIAYTMTVQCPLSKVAPGIQTLNLLAISHTVCFTRRPNPVPPPGIYILPASPENVASPSFSITDSVGQSFSFSIYDQSNLILYTSFAYWRSVRSRRNIHQEQQKYREQRGSTAFTMVTGFLHRIFSTRCPRLDIEPLCILQLEHSCLLVMFVKNLDNFEVDCYLRELNLRTKRLQLCL